MKKYSRSMFSSALFVILAAASAHAGALWLYEEATPGHGGGGRRPPGCRHGRLNGQRQPGRDDAAGSLPDGRAVSWASILTGQVQGPGDEL